MPDTEKTTKVIVQLLERIAPVLAGQPPEVQGAVIADLTAIWLSGHIAVGDPNATDEIHNKLLDMHIEKVRELVQVYRKAIERMADR